MQLYLKFDLPRHPEISERGLTFDVLFCTSVLNLAEFVAIR